MEKCLYDGKVLYAYQVLRDFEFEQKIRKLAATVVHPYFFGMENREQNVSHIVIKKNVDMAITAKSRVIFSNLFKDSLLP